MMFAGLSNLRHVCIKTHASLSNMPTCIERLVQWIKLELGSLKINIDGSSFGNPRHTGIGGTTSG